MLKTSLDMSMSMISAIGQMASIRRQIHAVLEATFRNLHLDGGMPLAEDGVLSNYRLEVLRLCNDERFAWRADARSTQRRGRGGSRKERRELYYEQVRRASLLDACPVCMQPSYASCVCVC